MPETKKLLVAFDPEHPATRTSDYLIPWNREGEHVLLGLSSGKEHVYGMTVFVGHPVSENHLFAKLVESGRFIRSVDETLSNLRDYVNQLQAMRVGNVARIANDRVGVKAYRIELVSGFPYQPKEWGT